jgi:amidohydrolase
MTSGGTDVVALRRDLHAHPEIAFAEHRTTEVIVDHLQGLGLKPKVLPSGTGVVCDIGDDGPVIGLRADIDALPIADLKDVPYRSTVDGMCHGCGHDAHTAILMAAADELVAKPPPGVVRLVFQPGEETVPGGALTVVDADVLGDLRQIFALHCDPRQDTGKVGVRVGSITAACDYLDITLRSSGGHTARPHLTGDLVYAAGLLITDLPALLSRRVDPRASLSMVWGSVDAGRAANAIPTSGRIRGTLRVLDQATWDAAEPLVRELIDQIVAPTGVAADVSYIRGLPPVINNAEAVETQSTAIVNSLGTSALATTEQSMGGEDFAWYLQTVPGALARLGVRRPGRAAFDLHQGTFDIDEDALDVGVRYTVALAHAALGS